MKLRLRINIRILLLVTTFIGIALILAASIRGYPGNPDIKALNTTKWIQDGPFELSPERGRYALLYSLAENHTFTFSTDIARFSMPDLGYINGKYVSLFAPGVSYILVPGYVAGKALGSSQIGTFVVIAIFALLNCVLLYKISRQLGASYAASLIAVLIFIFASPSFAYAVTIYQHHISTFLLLFSIYLLFQYDNFLALSLVWAMCAISLSVDYPNLFLMLPVGIFALGKVFNFSLTENKLHFSMKTLYLLSPLLAILPMYFFFWFNSQSYGSPFQLAGTVTQVKGIDANGNPTDTNFTAGLKPKNVDDTTVTPETTQSTTSKERNAVTYFKTRNMLNGFYILFISPDRGTVYFTPILLLGLIGIGILYVKKSPYLPLLVAIVLANVVLYAMWGDPWGGWAFGARYLIPGYAILSIFTAITLTELNKTKLKFLAVPIFALFMWCVYINTAGALTSNAIPPKVEVLRLEEISGKEQKYNYKRNLDMIKANNLKSFAYTTFFKDRITAQQYFNDIVILIGAISLLPFVNLLIKDEKNTQ